MKKLSKVLLVLVLCVACLAMTACSKSDDKKIVGKWDAAFDLGKMMGGSDSDAEAMTKYFSDGLNLTITFNFNDDKTGSLEVSDAALDDFKKVYAKGMKAMFTDMLGEDAAEMLGYDSMDDAVDAMMEDEMNTDDLKKEITKSFKYEIKDGSLKLTADDKDFLGMKYEFTSNSELKCTEVKDYTSEDNSLYGSELILKKK